MKPRFMPGFYDPYPGNPDYSHSSMDRHIRWESWVFGGLTRSTWKAIGGMTEFDVWVAIDMDFVARRQILDIRTKTMLEPDSFCVHQNHDIAGNVPTPRDMDKAISAGPIYNTSEEAIRSNLW